MRAFAVKPRWLAIALGALFVLYSILGFAVAPSILKPLVVTELAGFLGRPVVIRSFAVNPYAMSVIIRGFRIGEKSGGTFIDEETLRLRLDAWASLAHRSLRIKELVLEAPVVSIARDEAGKLSIDDLLGLTWPMPLGLRIGKLRLVDATIAFRDGSPTTAAATLSPLSATLSDFSLIADHENSFTLSAISALGGKISLDGSFRRYPFAARGSIELEGISLKAYSRYIAEFADFEVAEGKLSARASFDLDLAKEDRKALIRGGAIEAVSVRGGELEGGALKWSMRALSIGGIEADFARGTVEAASIDFDGFQASFRARRDGPVVRRDAKAGQPAPLAGWRFSAGKVGARDCGIEIGDGSRMTTFGWKSLEASMPAFQAHPPFVSVAGIVLEGGRLRFKDGGYSPAAIIAATGLRASIGGFSSRSPALASLSASATMGGASSLLIRGKANPIYAGGEAKLHGEARRIDIVRFSPYAERYLGYGLAAGELGLDSEWTIKGRAIDARNALSIDRLKLGDKVGGKNASKLPVRFLVSLIEDSVGRIALSVPIKGSLDDPELDLPQSILNEVFSPSNSASALH